MFKFSEAGIKNKDIFSWIYSDFIEWCKDNFTHGTFSTYCDGEPAFFSDGMEISYRNYMKNK